MDDRTLQSEFTRFLANLPPETSDADKLYVAALSLELFQRFADNPMVLSALSELLDVSVSTAATASFKNIQAGIFDSVFVTAREPLQPAAAPTALLLALQLYTEFLGASSSAEVPAFSEVLTAAAEAYSPPAAAPVAEPAATGYNGSCALFSESLVCRVFSPKPTAHDFINFVQRLSCSLVLYAHQLGGPQIRGWAFSVAGDAQFLLLETGEAFQLSSAELAESGKLVFLSDKKDYAAISATLLCLLFVASGMLHRHAIIDADAEHIVQSGFFGAPSVPHVSFQSDTLLAQVAAYMASDVQDPVSPVFSAPIPDTDLTVNLQFKESAAGPGLFSWLTDATGRVVFRNDTPRQICPFGVYLFPLPDQLFSLFLVPHG